MKAKAMKPIGSRCVVLVVGPPTPKRWMLAQQMLADGRAVLMCPAGPTCPLEREERCVLQGYADVTVASTDGVGETVRERIATCLRASPRAYAMEALDGDLPAGQLLEHRKEASHEPA